LKERQKRKRKEQMTDIVQAASSHLSRVSLKMTKAKFESMTSHDQNFEIMANKPSLPEVECNKKVL